MDRGLHAYRLGRPAPRLVVTRRVSCSVSSSSVSVHILPAPLSGVICVLRDMCSVTRLPACSCPRHNSRSLLCSAVATSITHSVLEERSAGRAARCVSGLCRRAPAAPCSASPHAVQAYIGRASEESRPRLFRPYFSSRAAVYPPNLRAIFVFCSSFLCHIAFMCADAPSGVLLPKTQFALPALQRGGH